uniref:Putative ovule protein n=1 Tax=Solanum chacoense TaxID=4108 RepID=A0A0V0H2A4_SOLCH
MVHTYSLLDYLMSLIKRIDKVNYFSIFLLSPAQITKFTILNFDVLFPSFKHWAYSTNQLLNVFGQHIFTI